MHKLPGVPPKNGSEIHGAVAELSREPRSKMITLLSLEDEEEDNKECVEDHHKTLNEDSCDGQNSLTPDYAQRCSSDNESFRSQETSDSECGSVSYTGGKCVRSFDKK